MLALLGISLLTLLMSSTYIFVAVSERGLLLRLRSVSRSPIILFCFIALKSIFISACSVRTSNGARDKYFSSNFLDEIRS